MEAHSYWSQHAWLRDAVAPVGILLLSLITWPSDMSIVFSLLLCLPLFWRRTAPEIVLCATVLVAIVQLGFLPEPTIGDLAVPWVVHAATAYPRQRGWGYASLAIGLLGSVIGPYQWLRVGGYALPAIQGLALVGVCALSVLVGFAVGLRDQTYRRSSASAEAERVRLLEIQQQQAADMGAAAERTRIARELHDIVAHSLSVVVVQAEGGRAAAKTKPEVASEVLGTIAGTARSALADMRRLVGVLRAGGGPETSHPDYAPAPTVADIPTLVDQVVAAGLPVRLQISGIAREVPPGIGLAAYRLVQESLTNVIKHAGPEATADVSVHFGPAELHVTVIDDGRGDGGSVLDGLTIDGPADGHRAPGSTPPDSGGNGLTGMRERVSLQGGSVAAHPRAGGGFIVTATLPTDRETN